MIEIKSEHLDSVARWHFAVGGLETRADTIAIGPAIRLQTLKVFPTHTELAHGLTSPLVAGIMQHYGENVIRHELVIDAEGIDTPELIPRTAGALLAAMRIRTRAEIICPAVCDTSWETLRGVKAESCIAYRVEPAMYAHEFGDPALVMPDDCEWVRDNLLRLLELSDDERFNTALDALCTYMHAANYRMMAAQLWAGVEALFDVQFEISFRLPLLAALFLKARGSECRKIRKHVKALYTERSNAIHGGKIDESALRKHVNHVRTLLSNLLGKMIQDGKVPTKDDFDDLTVME